MNTLVFPLLLGMLQTPDTVYVQPSFTVGMYVVQPTGRLRVAVDNHWQRRLWVRLVDDRHEVVYEDAISSKAQPYRRLFDLDQLTEGTYHLQISDGCRTVTHDVSVGAPIHRPARSVQVAADETTR